MIPKSIAGAHLRIARPTDRLDEVVDFYTKVIGFVELGRFVDHEGFDGVMLGHESIVYHLEFTHAHGHRVGKAPSQDHLLIFYVPDKTQWNELVKQLEQRGATPVDSFNPYWDRNGRTYEDPDGYRIVINNSKWAP